MNPGYYVLCGVGGYVVTSVALLIWPCFHRKKNAEDVRRSHISHRGGCAEGPENTMVAYKRAVAAGTEMIELDVHLSSDKKVVVSHDNNLQRTTGEDIHITDTHSEELPLLKRTLDVTFYHTVYNHDGEDVSLCLLEDVFKEFPNIPINLDIKEYNEETIHAVNHLVKKYNREHLLVWGNFSDQTCQKCYKVNPDIPVLFSAKRVLKLYLLFYSGLLPFFPLKETCLETAMPFAFRHTQMYKNSKWWKKALLRVINFIMMSRVLFYHLHKRGMLVYLWVLNDEEDFKQGFKLGADGVMTDYPTRLTKWLDDHPQYKTQNNKK